MKEEAGSGFTVKTHGGSGAFLYTLLGVLRLWRLRRWGSTRKKSVPTGFRWCDMLFHRFEFSDWRRPSKQPEQKITLDSLEEKRKKKKKTWVDSYFLWRLSCATSTRPLNTLLYLCLSSRSVSFFHHITSRDPFCQHQKNKAIEWTLCTACAHRVPKTFLG